MLKEFRSIDVYWDKATRRIYEEIRSSSSDEKGRKLTVQIVNDGQIQDLTSVALNLYWETQDGENRGLDPFTALDPENGIYELYFRTGMLKHVGKLNAHLHLVDTTGAITSEPFTIFVFEGVDVDAMESDDELSALNQALVEVQTIKQDFVDESNQLIATEKAELDALQADYADRAETLETTYAPRLNAVDGRLTAVEQNIDGHLADIVQTTEVNSSTKYPSAAVTFSLKNLISGIEAQLQGSQVQDLNALSDTFLVRGYAAGAANAPTAGADGVVLQFVGTYTVQIAFTSGSNDMYHRTKYGTWRGWKKVTSTSL